MILVDSNILLYAKFEDVPQHRRARIWFEEQLNGSARIGIPWQVSLAFLRLATNARVFARPLTIAAAWKQMMEWLDHPRVWIPEPTEEHASVLRDLLLHANVTGSLVADAHLAALAIEHGLTVCSADSDFVRFPAVSWLNPM
ncbi:MAG: TA system VapC family ribonuclease toxin, partial [Thermoanaerobaculia bacterium]